MVSCTVLPAILLAGMFSMVTGQATVRLMDTNLMVREGEQFTIRVLKTGEISDELVVIVAFDTDANDDYMGDTQVARFSPGGSDTSAVTFTVRDDDIPEDNEVSILRIRIVGRGAYSVDPSETRVTILANDDAFGVFSFSNTEPRTVEEKDFTEIINLEVKRDRGAFGQVMVYFTVNGSSVEANPNQDIQPSSGVIRFVPNERTVDLQLQIRADDFSENAETFFVYLTDTSPNAGINNGAVTVIILANDAPLGFSSSEYRYNEGPGDRTYSIAVHRGLAADGVTLIGSLDSVVTVRYMIASQSAYINTDFSATDGELVFQPGETSKTIPFTIIDDAEPEMDQDFIIMLSAPRGNVVFAPNLYTATVIITANDNPSGVISFRTDGISTVNPEIQVSEDEFKVVNFTVIRTAGTFGVVSVRWEVDHYNQSTDQVSSDVGPLTGTIEFPNAVSEARIALTVVQDVIPEPAEKFVVRLLDATGDAKVDGITEAYLLIEDSDDMFGKIEFRSIFQQRIITTDTSRSLQLELKREGGRSENLIANISLVYYDTNNVDRTDEVLERPYHEMFILQGLDIITDEVSLLPSAFLGTGGSFQAKILDVILETKPPFGSFNSPIIQTRNQVTIPITAAEANGEIGFASTEGVFVEEPTSGVQMVPLRISREGSNGNVDIRWTITGTGDAAEYVTDGDFIAMSGIVQMNSGVSSVDLSIAVQADDVPEIDEEILITLSIVDASVTQRLRPGSTEVNVTILANDNPAGVFQFAPSPLMQDSYSIQEGSEPITVIVERTGGSLSTQTVQYIIEPNAQKEFYGGTNVLRFDPGVARQTATIVAVADGIPEIDEVYTLRLLSYGDQPAELGPRTSIPVTVQQNDDPNGVIQFSIDPTFVYMGESTLTNGIFRDIIVQRSKGTFGVVTVDWSLSANANLDLTPTLGTLRFNEGVAQQVIRIQSLPDEIPEGDETYILQLGVPTGGALPGIPTKATIIIRENDHPVELDSVLKYAQEPSQIQFTVTRQGLLTETARVRYRTLDASASQLNGDFEEANRELEFQPGEPRKTFLIYVLDDNIPEGNETFTVQLYDLGGEYILTNKSTATVVILANDDAYGVFHFQEPIEREASEGETVYFNIVRDKGSYGEVDVFWEIHDLLTGTLVSASDEFEVTRGTVKFLEGQAQLPIAIRPLPDDVPENDKLYNVVLTGVRVISGRRDVVLARLDTTQTVGTLKVRQSDEPYGLFAFPVNQDEMNVAEDYPPGSGSQARATFTVERQQGSLGTTQVLWEVYSDRMGGNPPKQVDLLFVGNRPSTMQNVLSRQRPGTGSDVLLFTGASDSFVTVPASAQPLPEDIMSGFSLSAWVQPLSGTNGYILAKTSPDGQRHIYSLRLNTGPAQTTIEVVLARSETSSQYLSAVVTNNLQDSQWHHILVSVANGSAVTYLDGIRISTSALIQPNLIDETGVLMVGARPPGQDGFMGYMQDVRVYLKGLVDDEILEIYETPARKDIIPISGILTFSPGARTETFSIQSVQDIEEEGNEVFSVTLISVNGGASVADTGSIATLTVLKSDNANGLFGFMEECKPTRTSFENTTFSCVVGRTRGDDGLVTITWVVQQDTSEGYVPAVDDFVQYTGAITFGPGEREKTVEFQAREEDVPEKTEIFRVILESAISDDGIVGSTNSSGASIDPVTSVYTIIIEDTDYPHGLLQFSASSIPPGPNDPMIRPASEPITVMAKEEDEVAALLVVRAQGQIGQVSVEWRTTDGTARSEGKTPLDYIGAASRLVLAEGERFGFINITLLDNIIPEPDKTFTVELLNPVGGASVGPGSLVNVVIEASDGAFGIYQFAEDSVSKTVQETGDVGFTVVNLEIVRLGGAYGVAQVTWQAIDDLDNDLVENSGVVNFIAGQTSAQAEIRVRGDTEPELDEEVMIVITGSSEGDLGENTRRTATVTILANDDPYGMFVVSSLQRPITVQEENTDISITIQRLYGQFGSVDVSYASIPPNVTYNYLPGPVSRANYDDFQVSLGNVRFLPNQEFATFGVTIFNDDVPELDESIFVQLTQATLVQAAQIRPVPNSPRRGPDSQTYAQIIITSNDDASGVVELSASSLEVPEDVGPLQLYVLRSSGTFGEVTVRFRTLDQEARNTEDYVITGTEVILSDGETRKRVPIDIENDRRPEFTERFFIELIDPVVGGAALGATNRALITIQPSDDPNGAFEFARTELAVTEPENGQPYPVSITVVRTGGTQGVVTVQWEARINGELAEGDILPVTGFLRFVSNEGSRRIQINILPDDVPEGEEEINITLTSADNGGRISEKNFLFLRIAPNDNPHGVIEFFGPFYSLSEISGQEQQFLSVKRSGGTYGRLRIFFTLIQIPLSTLAAEQSIEVLSYFNTEQRGRRLDVGNAVDVSTASNPKEACAAACLDVDACVAFVFRVENNSPFCFWYLVHSTSLFPDTNSEYFIKDVNKVNTLKESQALPGVDYEPVPEASVIIEDQVASAQIPVIVLDDNLPELEEKFQVQLLRVVVDDPAAQTSQNPQLGNLKVANVIIPANDEANGLFQIFSTSPSATETEVPVEEKDRQAVDLIVERTGGTIGEVSVDWSVGPGATATYESDFIADGATLVFTDGQNRRVITVTIMDDLVPEDNETFSIDLSNPQGGASLGPRSSINVVILENDNVAGVIGLATTALLAREGDTFQIRVTRSTPAHGTVTVDWEIQGQNGAVPSAGFREYFGTLTFAPGEMFKLISLTVQIDATPEVNEEYLLVLSGITTEGVGITGEATINPQFRQALITIAGSDDPHGIFQFSSASQHVRVNEDIQRLNLQVDRKFGAIGTVRVFYRVFQGSLTPASSNLAEATPTLDFGATENGYIDIADGEAAGTIVVDINNDEVPEIDEVFLVRLISVELQGTPDGSLAPQLNTNITSEVIINANDGAKGVVLFGSDSRLVNVEENDMPITLSVIRDRGTFGTISVFYYSQTISSGAQIGVDYNVESQEMVFGPGEDRKNITVRIFSDDLPEPDETFEVILANPQNGAALGDFPKATVTILASDDATGIVEFDNQDDITLREPIGDSLDGSKVEIRLYRGPGIFGVVRVPFSVTSEDNSPVTDIIPASGFVTFEDMSVRAVLELQAVDDNIPEGQETFTLSLQTPDNAKLGILNSRKITVLPNDSPQGLFEIFVSNSRESVTSIEESTGIVNLDIVRSRGADGKVSVDVHTVAETAMTVDTPRKVTLALLQSIPAVTVSGWHSFEVGSTTYILLLTSLPTGTSLRSQIPASPYTGDGQSALFRWQGEAIFVQTVSTNGATAATSFTIDGQTYLVIANSGSEGQRVTESTIFTVTEQGVVSLVQALQTTGASDVEFIGYNDQYFMAITSSLDSTSRSNLTLGIYLWSKETKQFLPNPWQSISTLYARGARFFVLENTLFMAVASYYDWSTSSYETSSVIYKMGQDLFFSQHQTVSTKGAMDVEYVDTGPMKLLVFANNRQNVVRSPQKSPVYRYDSATQQFLIHTYLDTTRAQSVASIKDGDNIYLVFANTLSSSQIFMWNLEISMFDQVWSGTTQRRLEPITIQQTGGPLHLLAGAPVEQQEQTAILYQLARVDIQSDFVPRRVTLTFYPGETILRTTAVVLQDNLPEDTETFSISLDAPTQDAEIGPSNSVKVNILSNDNAHGIIEFSNDSLTVLADEKDGEDNTIQLYVIRKAGHFGHVVVRWQATGDHSGLSDITPLEGQVEFANGHTTSAISLTIRDDEEAEFAEETYIQLMEIVEGGTTLSGKGATLGRQTTSKVTVLANDSPHGVVSWETALTTTVEPEGTDQIIRININREQGSVGAIRVLFVTSNAVGLPLYQQAKAGEDYVSRQGSVTMPDGVTKAEVQITVKQDDIPEADESFYVNITTVELLDGSSSSSSQPSVRVQGSYTQIMISENDNARGLVQFNVTLNVEGRVDTYEEYQRTNTIILPLSRTIGLFGEIIVTWQAAPIEANTDDFSPSDGTVRFASGQSQAQIEISITDDTTSEPMEMFDVRLTTVNGGASIGLQRSVRVAILKNDSPTGLFRFATMEVSTKEGASSVDPGGQVTLLVERVQGAQGLVLVEWRLEAGAEEDFLPPLQGTLNFNEGEVRKSIVLQTKPDDILEGEERFIVSMTSASNDANIAVNRADATVIIQADPSASGTVSVVESSRIVYIGEPGEAEPSYDGRAHIVLTRGDGIYGPISVTWSLSPREAQAFLQLEGTITFVDLQQTATVVLEAKDDTFPELPNTFTFVISAATGGAVISGEAGADSALVMFVASDHPHGCFEFTIPDTVIVEEDIGSVEVEVRRLCGEVGRVQVSYTSSPGTAEREVDYFPVAGTLQFENAVRRQVIQVTIKPDDLPEGPEEFYLNLTSVDLLSHSNNDYTKIGPLQLSMRPTIGVVNTKTVIIQKNDNAEGTIQFSPEAVRFRVKEEDGVARIPVVRTGGSYGDVSVRYDIHARTASQGDDYIGTGGKLDFIDGVSETTLDVNLVDDNEMEFDETFVVTLTVPEGGVQVGTPKVATVVIAKSDFPNGKFGFLGQLEIRMTNPPQVFSIPMSVERTGGLLGRQTVSWRIMGPNNPDTVLDDTSDIIYNDNGREVTQGSLTWEDGESGAKDFTLLVKPYSSWEVEKVFVVKIYNIQGPQSLGNGEPSPAAGEVKITIEKFGSPNGVIGFDGAAQGTQEVEEPAGSNTLPLNFALSRRPDTGVVGVVQIFWEVEGPPGMKNDIQPTNGSIFLASEERTGVITLSILPDSEPELTETFTLIIKRIEGGADIDDANGRSVFRIRYNDNPHGQIGVVASNQMISVNPSDMSRSLVLNLTRHDGSFGRVSVEYTAIYDLPQIGITVSPNTGTVVFEDGASFATATIAIGGNGFMEVGSTFSVSLNRVQFLGGGVTERPRLKAGETEAKVAVPPSAGNSEVSFAAGVLNVDQATRTVLLTLTRRGTYGEINVDWMSGLSDSALPSGTVNGEITPALGTLKMTHGTQSANLTVQVSPRMGQSEVFAIRIPGPPKTTVSGGARVNADESVARIEPYGLVQFEANSITPDVTESDREVSLTVVRLYGSEGRVEVRYSTQSATAQGNFDYREVQDGSMVLEPGVVSNSFTIDIFPDQQPESTEIFYVNLTEVIMFPTPQNPIPSPRVSQLYSQAIVSIRESNDPYGVLSLKPWLDTNQEELAAFVLTLERTGGVFGRTSVQVRTVGGGESWTDDIAVQAGSSDTNTISQVLGNRRSDSIATGGLDYEVLDTVVTLEAGETSKQIDLQILEDNLAEPGEVVLVYLTQPTGGARIAVGEPDGGKRGFAMITIEANDMSNGRIGFAEDSKLVTADEDTLNPVAILSLMRLNAFFGEVNVTWKAKKSATSTDLEDADLPNQLKTTTGVTRCAAGQQICTITVELVDDQEPEEEYRFLIELQKVEKDAELNENSKFAIVIIRPSDFVRGRIGFTPDTKIIIVGDNDRTATVKVERTMGQDYEVQVTYQTEQIDRPTTDGGVDIYVALEGSDFQSQKGVLTIQPGKQNPHEIDITLTPVTASRDPLPKQFRVILKDPNNEASLHPENYIAIVRIVKQSDVSIWRAIVSGQEGPLTDDNIRGTLDELDPQIKDDMDDEDVTLIEDFLDKISAEGEKRELSDSTNTKTLGTFCKLLNQQNSQALKGRVSLSKSLEKFAYTLVKHKPCPSTDLVSQSCAVLRVTAGRWTTEQLQGHRYLGLRSDLVVTPQVIPGLPDTGTECQDFYMIEYNRDRWFQTAEDTPELLMSKVVAFGVKGKASAYTASPVSFKIHSPDRRVSTSRAECVFFDEGINRWTSQDLCRVTNPSELSTDDFVNCSCNHMTNYAVIARTTDPGLIYYELWFYICCAISMACLLLVILLHHICHVQPMISASLFMHLLFAAFATQLCFVLSAYLSKTGILLVPNFTDNNYRCIIMGNFLHYFFLAQFTWMMTLGVNFWKLLVMNDEHTDRKYVLFFILGWGMPLLIVGAFYAVVYNLYKYVYTAEYPDFIHGDVNNNNEICFIRNEYAAVGGVIVPVLLMLLVVCVVFMKAFQMVSQWESYDDIYRGRYNRMEIKLMILVWGLLVLTWLWAGLHMVYGQLWMIILFCVFDLLLGLVTFILFGILRNPCMPYSSTHKASYAVSVGDFDATLPSNYNIQPSPGPASFKGSRASLLHEAWERDSLGPRSQMTVKRALPSQVYINPPVSIISPPSQSDIEDRDFDELLYALKAGGSFAPSELSHGVDDTASLGSDRLERYETKRIDIADTHL